MAHRQTIEELIAESLRELGREVDFGDITVARIAENAGVSKRTFYNHFQDKYALVAWIFERNNEEALAAMSEGDTFRDFLKIVFDMFADDSAFYVNILRHSKGLDSYVRILAQSSERILNRYFQAKGKVLTDKERFTVRFAFAASMHAGVDWVEQGMPFSKETLAEWIADSLPSVVDELVFGKGAVS